MGSLFLITIFVNIWHTYSQLWSCFTARASIAGFTQVSPTKVEACKSSLKASLHWFLFSHWILISLCADALCNSIVLNMKNMGLCLVMCSILAKNPFFLCACVISCKLTFLHNLQIIIQCWTKVTAQNTKVCYSVVLYGVWLGVTFQANPLVKKRKLLGKDNK